MRTSFAVLCALGLIGSNAIKLNRRRADISRDEELSGAIQNDTSVSLARDDAEDGEK